MSLFTCYNQMPLYYWREEALLISEKKIETPCWSHIVIAHRPDGLDRHEGRVPDDVLPGSNPGGPLAPGATRIGQGTGSDPDDVLLGSNSGGPLAPGATRVS
ncbi:hypothetical protein L6452_21801 [Arctium lappa]|uniref:Uncharacterized protein n=1 Tax=Arctium lappa TaxID=4217 RepID=A0ACB9AYP4_ARCLA|nr:hypothetical protein L6452_21801 [Arctium lappa]